MVIMTTISLFAGGLWVFLFLYFIKEGITPTLGRIAISTMILTAVSVSYARMTNNEKAS